MERKVIVIPKAEPLQTDSSGTVRKKRVCAYARVSTDFEDQKNGCFLSESQESQESQESHRKPSGL